MFGSYERTRRRLQRPRGRKRRFFLGTAAESAGFSGSSQRSPELFRGTSTQGCYTLVLGPKTREIPESMVSRILMFTRSFLYHYSQEH